MATANRPAEREPLRCLLCYRQYTNPRTLPCHHTYCEKCLSSYIESAGLQETDSGTKFDCPACRRCIEVSDSSLSEGEIASSFPLHTLYVSLFSSSDDKECGACRRISEKQASVVWCNDCGEALCTACYATHRKLRLTSKHKVVDIDDNEQHMPYLGELHRHCCKHSSKAVEVYCLSHREPCCSVCVPTRHSGCKPIRSVEDVGKRFSKYPNRFSCLPELEHMRTQVKMISDEEETHLACLDKEYIDVLSSMETLITKSKSNLDLLHEYFKENTKEKWHSKKQKLKDFQLDSRMLQTNFENCVKIISAITDRASSEDQFLIQEQLKAQISSHSQEMSSKMKHYRETRLTLEPESVLDKIAHSLSGIVYVIETECPSVNVQNVLSKMDENIAILKQKPEASLMEDSVSAADMLDSLVISQPVGATEGGGDLTGRSLVTNQPVGATEGGGDLTGRSLVTNQPIGATEGGGDLTERSLVTNQPMGATEGGGDLTGRSLVTNQPVVGTGSGVDLMAATTKKVKSVTRSDIGGKGKCTGGVFLAEDSLLISDCVNKQILCFDSEYNVVTKTKLPERSENIAYSHSHRTVLVKSRASILKYSVTGAGLQYTGKLALSTRSPYFCGIAVHNDTIVVGTGVSVQLLTMDGTVQKTIPRTGRHTYVAVCGDLKRFCYPDNDVIVCCDINGTEKFRYSDTNLANIVGLACDRWGHIYVCCFHPVEHVYQISPDGQRGRVLRLDQSNISQPRHIVCHPTKNEILVTSISSESVAFEVFTLA